MASSSRDEYKMKYTYPSPYKRTEVISASPNVLLSSISLSVNRVFFDGRS